jgi:D-alanyl-D-alanine carboxypeptidase
MKALITRGIVLSAMLGGLLLAPPGGPATATTTHEPADRSRLGALLDPLVAAGAPGAAVRITDGRRARTAARGLADLARNRPMRPDLTYRAGSVTKPMVATVVLQLVGEGRVRLTDTVEDWLPGILPYADQVTVRHLLTMTSGVPEYLRGQIAFDTYGPTPARLRSWSPRELVAIVAARPPTFAPGTGFEYSNTNYVLAGMIVEAATGASLGRELARRVFRPLGMRDTSFPVDNPTIAGRNAHGYSLPVDPQQGPVEGGPLRDVTLLNPSFAWAAGNVVSDLDDLTRFLGALLAGRLLAPGLLAEMTTPVDTGDPEASYGMGLEFIHTPCGTVVGHSGSIAGFHNIVLATGDGSRQFGLMVNQQILGRAAAQAFPQVAVALMRQLFAGTTCDAAPSSLLRADRYGYVPTGTAAGTVSAG